MYKEESKLKKPRCRSLSSQDTIDVDETGNNAISLPLIVGICAMKKKAESGPMKEILKHFSPEELQLKFFDEEMILNQKPSEWPVVDVLLSFYSSGFPLAKAQEYCELRKPMLINDLKKQELLWDRSLIYKELGNAGIPTPNYYFVHRHKNEDLISKYKFNLNNMDLTESEANVENKKDALLRSFLNKATEEFKQMGGSLIEKSSLMDHHEKHESKDLETSKETKRKSVSNSLNNLSKMNSNNSNDSDLQAAQKKLKIDKLIEMPEEEKNQFIKSMIESNTKTRTLSFSLMNEEIVFCPILQKPKRKCSEEFIIEECDDYILINDTKINKPFVEKPFDAENHDINIYYPMNDGGGCKHLFRKVGNVSSKFDPICNEIRRNGNYIYEEFLPTDGFDIKVYTVGPDYAHAEARKSPVLDGKVQRTVTGKEVRYPVTLTPEEKIIARKISLWFGQNVCGFDLLRSNGNSYVCDVNGWSFVKGNNNYYRDCALMLRHMILLRFAPSKLESLNIKNIKILTVEKNSDSGQEEDNMISSMFRPEINEKIIPSKEELRSVVAVFRHGDRTPKQKMKMKVKDPRFLEFFDRETDKSKEIIIKKAVLLQKILDISRVVISELNRDTSYDSDEDHDNNISKLFQLVSVLEKGGHFEEINRKIQIKPLKNIIIIDEQGVCTEKVVEALFIVKWGGELTHSGEFQAEHIGQMFRTYLYPNENEGILRLHSTYRHDLKIYSSDEGRCLKTAGAFCKGFLNLDGELTPIIVSMVRKDELAQELLDLRNHKLDLADVMKILTSSLNHSGKLEETLKEFVDIESVNSTELEIIRNVGEPLDLMKKLLKNIKELTKIIRSHLNLKDKTYYINPLDMKLDNNGTSEDENQKSMERNKGFFLACGQENMILVFKRWRKLEIDFFDRKNDNFNISKIPDIHDSIRYDMIHNYQYFGNLPDNIGFKIYESADKLAKFLTPFEYGIIKKRKFDIGMTVIEPLFKKIKSDLLWWNTPVAQSKENYREESDYWMIRNINKENPDDIKDHTQKIKSKWRHIRTRLYFTSASHLYSLFNVIKYGADSLFIHNKEEINKIDFLNYLSHIVFRLFENLTSDAKDPKRFRLELHVSSGNVAKIHEQYKRHNAPISPLILVNKNLSLIQLEEFFKIVNK